ADPRVDLRGREREAQGETYARDTCECSADARQHESVCAAIDAERRRDRCVLGQRTHGAAQIRIAHCRPYPEAERQRERKRKQFRYWYEQLADAKFLSCIDRLELAKVGGPFGLDAG